ncbi:DNA-binding transcriptional regulator, XRE family [Butyrivibrio sp. ob235]|nr:DNA-binding transcriptional regulator, XRE family [Butyrivibrio sp. ob235]
MISYEPMFETMRNKGITEYSLIFKEGISANTIHRIKKGLPCTTETLDTLCFILDCEIQDIIKHDKTK